MVSQPSICATSVGCNEIVKILLESGADADKETNDGMSPLLIVAQEGKVNVVEYLVEEGKAENR